MALLAVNDLAKSYGERTLFDRVCFEVEPRDRIGLVGVNGCGKTTIFKLLTGVENPDSGRISISRDTSISYMEQMTPSLELSLYDAVLNTFAELLSIETELESVNERISAGGEDVRVLVNRQHSLNERYERQGGLTFRSRTRSTLMGLGFTQEELDQRLATMSGGQRSKAQLACVLLSGANLLLLDEPTNHLDIASVDFLEDFLSGYSGAFIVISHDRYFLDKVTKKTIELENCKLTVSLGNYSRHLELKATDREIAIRHYQRTQREIKRIYGIVEQQRRWGQERNFVTAEAKLKQIKRLEATLVKPEALTDRIHFDFQAGETGGNDVLIAESLGKSYGEKQLFEGVDLHITRGERVFILGANGCGKTTLLRILNHRETPDSGDFYLGSKVTAGYYDQSMEALDGDSTVLDEIWSAFPKLNQTEVRSALAAFLFRGDDITKRIGSISGGEKARVQLLKLMLAGTNLLMLDEPTNHLDLASREALENALDDYGGTMLVVTHDRYLVNRLADRVLYMENGGLTEYIGGYDDYLEQRATRQHDCETVEEKQVKPNAYKAQKERQGALNRARGEVKRLEERISAAEQENAALEQKLASPAVASDYTKAMELSKTLDEQKRNVQRLYDQWEQAQKSLEELEEQE